MLVLPILFCVIASAFAASSSSSASSSASASSYGTSSMYIRPYPTTTGACRFIVGQSLDFYDVDGNWYEAQRSENNYDSKEKCTRFNFKAQSSTNAILRYFAVSELAPMTSKTISTAERNQEGWLMTYHVPTAGNLIQERIVLSFNKDDHLILYSCEDLPNNEKREMMWVHSRTPSTGAGMQAIIDSAMERYNLQSPAMHIHDNSGCGPYYDSYDL